MSRKSRKKARTKFRPPVSATAAPRVTGPTTLSQPRALSQARVGGDQAFVRSVEMSLGATNRTVKSRGGRMIVESADPSIPLDRVPYFTTDLVRLAFVAGAMVVLLAIGAFTVPQLVK